MGGGSSFLAILRIVGFFSAIWVAGKGARYAGISTIVPEIVVGLLLSPSVLELMPPPYSECQHKDDYDCSHNNVVDSIIKGHHTPVYHLLDHHDLCEGERGAWESYVGAAHRRLADLGGVAVDQNTICASPIDTEGVRDATNQCINAFNSLVTCAVDECDDEIDHLCIEEPNVFTMVGHAGVSLMIFESGMHFDFEKAKVVGPKACIVAVLGTILPIIAGMAMTLAFGEDMYPDGLAVGVALAPTSVGIALKLLSEAKQLQKDFGQAIITAAFVDDILSLIAFNVLFAVTEGEFSILNVVIKPIIGVIFMCFGAFLGLKFWPKVIERLADRRKLPANSDPHPTHGISRSDEVLLFLMFILLIGYSTFTWWLGTHLWGCFVAGMSFATIHRAHHLWSQQSKRITVWMLRIFFSCTVAFAIPFDELLSFEAFWQGTILSMVACIMTKVLCAFFMGEAKWVIGWAMVGRAEFAYLIAEMAKSAGIMTEKVFAVVIWALLWATILAPLCFKWMLERYGKVLEKREMQQEIPNFRVDKADGKTAENAKEGKKIDGPTASKLEIDRESQASTADHDGVSRTISPCPDGISRTITPCPDGISRTTTPCPDADGISRTTTPCPEEAPDLPTSASHEDGI